MIIKHTRLDTDAYVFAKFLFKKTLIKAKSFQILFWSLTVFSIFFAFFTTLMGVFKLASSKLSEFESFSRLFIQIDASGKEIDQWPIFVLWINLSISLMNGLFALFFVKNRWLRNQEINNFLRVELILYKNKVGKYKYQEHRQIELYNIIFSQLGALKALEYKHIFKKKVTNND
ncbi:Uncharacterised protein [Mesomycoplasma conjunctivae]|nr:DUF4231 domain-containing protein [Mesomycoplasma conjunctivae]VEU66542.1 Uncharacterised protein [Mesomycoplasma conjunctivae]